MLRHRRPHTQLQAHEIIAWSLQMSRCVSFPVQLQSCLSAARCMFQSLNCRIADDPWCAGRERLAADRQQDVGGGLHHTVPKMKPQNLSSGAQVKGDVRLINSKVFAADYSMRFPTVVRTRWDKPPAEVQTHEELCQVVQQRVEAGGLSAMVLAELLSADPASQAYAVPDITHTAGGGMSGWFQGYHRTRTPLSLFSACASYQSHCACSNRNMTPTMCARNYPVRACRLQMQ
jgi:hypothetical protein